MHFVTTELVDINEDTGFEVFTAETMKYTVFWDVAQCGFIISRRFGGTCHLLQGRRNNASEEKR
jgi:hypothetical protein